MTMSGRNGEIALILAGCFCFALLLTSSMIFGCKTQVKEEKDTLINMATRDINEVKEEHTAELMALPGVVGVYVGMQDNDTLCIRVMVVKLTDELRAKIPKTLEGHPVEIEESGEIRPLREDQE
jgi:hypothetical protein